VVDVLKNKTNKEKDNSLQHIIEDIKDIEKLLDLNRKAYDDIEDENLIEANIYEHRGLMIRYNYLLCLARQKEKEANPKSQSRSKEKGQERMGEKV
jgi:hypothetical protein